VPNNICDPEYNRTRQGWMDINVGKITRCRRCDGRLTGLYNTFGTK
jgi:hypothetical protein